MKKGKRYSMVIFISNSNAVSISSNEYFFNCKHRRWFPNYFLILKGSHAIITKLACEFHQTFRNFDGLYNILHIFAQLIQISCLTSHFCVQAVFKVPLHNIFPTKK